MAEQVTLSVLERADEFVRRHIGPDDPQIRAMLDVVNARSLDELIEQATPATIRTDRPLELPEPLGERAALDALRKMAERNRVQVSMIGMGYYDTITPPVIQRNVLENPGWYTAYTPYQAEVSQGRLEALLTFQQMVIDLTGLELANASLLDEATAAAEAMAMARRIGKSSADAFFVDADCHPQTLAVLRTRAGGLGLKVATGDPFRDLEPASVFGALLHYPGSSGAVRDFRPVIQRLRDAQAVAVMATDLLSLLLLTSPGELGADVAIGSAQRFGVPMGYGGPHAAFFATRDAYKRAVPGRLIGVSVDAQGRAGSARGRCRDVRRVPRPGRAQAHRRARAPPDPDPRCGPEKPRHRRDHGRLFRHAHGAGAGQGQEPGGTGLRARHQLAHCR